LEKGKTITGASYSSLLDRLKKSCKKKSTIGPQKILFHHNVPANSSGVVAAKLMELGFHIPLFSRFGYLGLLLIPQYQEMAGEILFKRGSDCGNECLFCRVMPILLFGRDRQTGAALEKLYKLKRRLEKKRFVPKN